jgi:hypothetical protein
MASSDLTPVEEAIDHLVARARPITRSQTVALTNSLDRVLARDYSFGDCQGSGQRVGNRHGSTL